MVFFFPWEYFSTLVSFIIKINPLYFYLTENVRRYLLDNKYWIVQKSKYQGPILSSLRIGGLKLNYQYKIPIVSFPFPVISGKLLLSIKIRRHFLLSLLHMSEYIPSLIEH